MRKLLMATAAMLGTSLGMAQAAQISVVNPSLTTQPPVAITGPATAALSAGYKPPLQVAPGSLVVRLELRENVYAVGGWNSTDNIRGDKVQPYGIIGYPRFYLGFDGMATNGLKYGVFWEIRNGANRSSTVNSAASGTAGNPGNSGSQLGPDAVLAA